ncbi:MAG: hypothetical protein K9I92_03065 [Chitinophagaceae bacterium]|jgi:asparagine synthase (glutamine-hydrolysing)|nr:hypothetical protein [Chitinophagaceae bacterium]
MSGFFGIFRPWGGPVDHEAFDQMKTAIHKEGFDGMETHVEDKIAMGHLMLRVSPESAYDKQPLESSCGNYLLAGHFRLDYRDELGDKLGITQAELEVTPDSQLVMLAYQKWREKCVYYLEGDWGFVLFNKLTTEIFLSRDSTGISSLFFINIEGQFYFSSDSRYLLSMTKFDFEIENETLFKMSQVSYNHADRQTLIKELFYLESAEYLIVDFNLNYSFHTYASLEISESVKYKYQVDYVSDLNFIYSCAIRSRMNDQKSIGIYLSGGKDSSSIAYFAAKELEFRGKELSSFTSFPAYKIHSTLIGDRIINETDYVKDLTSSIQNISPTFLNFPDFKLYEFFEKKSLYEAYNPVVHINSFWVNGIIEEAKKKGINNLLSGQIGNYTITLNGFYYYSDLLIRLRFFTLIKEFIRELKFSDKGLFHALKIQLAIPLAQHFKFTYSAYKSQRTKKILSFIEGNQDAAESSKSLFGLEIMFLKSLFTPYSLKRESHLKRNLDSLGNKWYLFSNHCNVQVTDPTADIRLINFLNAIPQNLFFQNGIHKYIFRKLMKTKLPDSILWNNKYQYQSFDFAYRLQRDRDFAIFFDKMIAQTSQNTLFNKSKLLDVFKDSIEFPEKYLSTNTISHLFRNFSIFCFLLYNQKE